MGTRPRELHIQEARKQRLIEWSVSGKPRDTKRSPHGLVHVLLHVELTDDALSAIHVVSPDRHASLP